MSDLPQDTSILNQQTDSLHSPPPSITVGGKEGEVASITPQELPLTSIGQEIELPKEVVSVGVSATPQTVTLPDPVIQAGVTSTGAPPIVVEREATAHIPLTDDQIAKALHESVTSSVRWLAEWCVRQMKLMHTAVKGNKHA